MGPDSPRGCRLISRPRPYLTVNNNPDDRQGSYSRSDAMLTYDAGPTTSGVLEAYGKNLENKAIIIAAQENGLCGTYNYQLPIRVPTVCA